MRIKNDQAGLTLVELLVTIVVASIVTLAACTMLLFGLRINNQSTKTSMGQNTVQVLMEALEDVAAEAKNLKVEDDGSAWKLSDAETQKVYYSYFQNVIYTGNLETPFLKNVFSSSISCEGKLLSIDVQVGNTNYSTNIYCRLLNDENVIIENDGEIIIRYLQGENVTLPEGTQITSSKRGKSFLEVLAKETDSRGEIKNKYGNDVGDYYSEWYIYGYKESSGWNKDTPWCACFVSWALCHPSVAIPTPLEREHWFADVDEFAKYYDVYNRPDRTGSSADLIFFNFDEDMEADHVGAVLATQGDYIYTIEGNTTGKVAVRKYNVKTDNRILGFVSLFN